MKNFKKILACVMAVATLGSVSAIPMNVDATTVTSIPYFDYIGHHSDNYYKEYSVTGKTGIIKLSCDIVSASDKIDDKSIIYDTVVKSNPDDDTSETYYKIATIDGIYYYDDTNGGEIVNVDSLDISKLDNLVMCGISDADVNENILELLSKNNIDVSQCENIYYNMPFFYNKDTNEYLRYGYNDHCKLTCDKDWLVVGAYLPDKLSSVNDDDIISYLNDVCNVYTELYLSKNKILDNPIFTAPFDDKDNFTTKNNVIYYKSDNSLGNFNNYIDCSLFFESENPNLTIDDVLTKEQQEFLCFNDGHINIKLGNNGINQLTGLTEYHMYLPICKDDLSYNDFMVYKYKIGQSLLDKGIAKNSFFSANVGHDDFNAWSAKSNLAIVMADGSEPTPELLGKYANEVESIEKVSNADNNLLIDDDYYYKINLVNMDSANLYEDYNSSKEIIRTLQDNENVKYIGAVDVHYFQTELAMSSHSFTYEIPILPSNSNKSITEITVGDSTFPRGDINLDGKTNTLDLLMLKKYLLGLMEW